MTQEHSSAASDVVESMSRVARDYAYARIEWMASTDLNGYTLSDINDIAESFHSAQLKVLHETPKALRTAETRYTVQFEKMVKGIRCILLENSIDEKPVVQNISSTSAKLPKIVIKPFDGKLDSWISFKQLFDSLVHERKDLGNVEKLHYLISSVQGPAYDLIKNYPLCNDNYILAYNALSKQFNRKRQIATMFYDRLINCEPVKHSRASELERVHRTFVENLSILNSYELPDKNFMLVQLLWSKLDKQTKEHFELEHNSDEIPSFDSIVSCLEKRCHALEAANMVSVHSTTSVVPKVDKKPPPKSVFVASNQSCVSCSGQHQLCRCPSFLDLDPHSRFTIIKNHKLCIQCFSPMHTVKNCKSQERCSHCQFSHHTLLHFQQPGPVVNATGKHQSQQMSSSATALTSSKVDSSVLFSTASVLVKNRDDRYVKVRALLDCASACNFITEACARTLGLNIQDSYQPVNGIGQTTAEPSGKVMCQLKSTDKAVTQAFSLETYVLPDICHRMPSSFLDRSTWSHVEGLTLADPELHRPGPIDMLLGADVFASCLRSGLIRGKAGQPTAINTVFGWILMGSCTFESSFRSRGNRKSCFLVISNFALDESIKRFWDVENVVYPHITHLSKEDQLCEKYFTENYRRLEEGRFVVPLPFKDPALKPSFVGSRAIALKRLLSLEKKLHVNQQFSDNYHKFMDDYEQCEHMETCSPPEQDKGGFFYIPHHGVLRPSSTSTPLRVVFDASSGDARGVSLNDNLMAGQKLQKSIFDVLLRFRWHAVVFTADVKQMYRQIRVLPEDADYQRILWRPSPEEPIRDYRLLTVTYGVSSAPYLALRTIAQLAKEFAAIFPAGASVLARDIYVDDVVSGTSSLSEAARIRFELSEIMSSGGFHLRKWTSNCEAFLADLPESELYSEDFRQFESLNDVSLKVLGLRWSPRTDSFTFDTSVFENRCTKRTILSEIARIFDPLGLLSPVVFLAKYIMQLLWLSGVDWDDDAPENISEEWSRFKTQLPSLCSLAIPRRVVTESISLQIHGFCDASERGFCAVVYFRVIDLNKAACVRLCCAKSKVAPLRQRSIPRLELLAAVLLSELLSSVINGLKDLHAIEHIFAWSDSSVALTWIKSCPSRWKTFVANRVAQIQESVSPTCWRHVSTHDNPADCGSRGLLPAELIQQTVWWAGPSWLSEAEESWPQSLSRLDQAALDEQKIYSLYSSSNEDFVDEILKKYSTLERTTRVLAYCFRYLDKLRNLNHNCSESLSCSEKRKALLFLVKHVQECSFASEIRALHHGSGNSLSKPLRKLCPFVDEDGLLRVGGRLSYGNMTYEVKHPLLLPRDHRLTYLIIDDYHTRFMHPGLQTLQNLLTQKFWILSPKRAIRSVVSGCVKCFRANPRPAPAPLMGNLPSYRINEVKPFSSVAIDYGGPFDIALGRGRGVKTFKGYICVFVCTSTKAIHLELASELSMEAFLAALRRFIARRGRCTRIVSDQGRNFVGASNYLGKLVKDAVESLQIKFSFNPPGSPHFNGLAEAGIKSVKTHLTRVIGAQRLTYEEFHTVLCQIEALLNSRPLTPLSSDVHDLSVLTPGHFLTLEPLSILPEENFVDQTISVLHRWKLLQKMHQDFWRRWHLEYLHTLQQRAKWNRNQGEVTVGTLVLIINEQISPLKWNMGRVIALHPGQDGVCRVVTLRTASGQFKRPIVKLCPLPMEGQWLK